MTDTKILVLGASGMLGSAVYCYFAQAENFQAVGTLRSGAAITRFPTALRDRLRTGINVEDPDALIETVRVFGPQVVINCVGVVKQLESADDPLQAIPINSLLPHRLARICAVAGARLVHISTDCVFDGAKGNYSENDRPNAYDLYGRSKLLGEVDQGNAITLRTSIIGHELGTSHGLVDWFLSQKGAVKGFSRAIFSGLPTAELARVIAEFVLPRPHLRGLYHVSAAAISKLDLLRLVATEYSVSSTIVPDDKVAIDRSLDSSRFRAITGYVPPAWPELVATMHQTRIKELSAT